MRKIFFCVFLTVALSNAYAASEEEAHIVNRQRMVEEQIQRRGITDKRVLDVMRKVERHLFVPAGLRKAAYADMPLPIGMGQTISQPYIVALMTELLNLKGDERVLEIGTGSGYQAAILAELAKEVYSIEILAPLAANAKKLFQELGYSNIYLRQGDGFLGWPESSPFDAIIVTCAPDEIPGPLIEQLAEGARLVIPLGEHWQSLKLAQKVNGKLIVRDILPVRFVPMLREKEGAERREDKDLAGNLKRHVIILSRDIGERNLFRQHNLERAAAYIKQEFVNYGYEAFEQVYYLEDKSFRNIIASKKGWRSPGKIIIICAHYDSAVGSPGADDNASGVAGVLELARLLSAEKADKTVSFIAFTNEEPPFFMSEDMGSLRYAREARRKGDDIEGVLCLESIGYYSGKIRSQSYPPGFRFFYPDKGNFIAMVSNFRSRHLLDKIIKGFRRQTDFPVESLVGLGFLAPAVSFSDHWSFWKFGYRAAMITDTAFYRNPYYHTADDTFDKLDFASMSEVVIGLHRSIQKLLNPQ